MDKPESLEEAHLEFLDDLRESGVTNMFGAGPYLVEEFGLSRNDSHKVLKYWMDTFTNRHPKND